MVTLPRILFFAVAIIGGGFWSASYLRKVRYDREVEALADTMKRDLWRPDADSAEAQRHFFKALLVLSDFRDLQRAGNVDAEELEFLSTALNQATSSNTEVYAIARSLRENLDICEKARIFTSPGNAQKFANGIEPTILAGSWEGETLVISRRIAPTLSREAWNHPANFQLVPASAAAMLWPMTVNDAVKRASDELTGAGVISAAAGSEIRQLYEQWVKMRSGE